MGKKRKMDDKSARRIQRNADKNPGSKTAKTGFKKRAQRAAKKNKK